MKTLSRRDLLKASGASIGATALTAFPAFAVPRTIKIGIVSPETGPIATFAEPTAFVLKAVTDKLDGMIDINGSRHPFEFIVKNTQSSPNRGRASQFLAARRGHGAVGSFPQRLSLSLRHGRSSTTQWRPTSTLTASPSQSLTPDDDCRGVPSDAPWD